MATIGQKRLTRAERMTRYGYYTEDDVIDPEHCARLRLALARLQREGHAEYRKEHQDYYPNVIEFDEAFAELLDNPRLIGGMEEVVGPDVQLYANEVLVSKGTDTTMGWHRDKMSIGKHCPNMFVKVCLYVDEIVANGGPTGVVPESNLDADKGEEFYPYKIDYFPKPGSLLAFGANTMHRAGLHAKSAPDRPVIFMVFIPWWIKQATYYTGNRCEPLIATASPLRKQLLGIEMRPGINMDLHSDP
jgi:hypothetical protein